MLILLEAAFLPLLKSSKANTLSLILVSMSSSNQPQLSDEEVFVGYSLEVPLVPQGGSFTKTRLVVEMSKTHSVIDHTQRPNAKPSLCLDLPRLQLTPTKNIGRNNYSTFLTSGRCLRPKLYRWGIRFPRSGEPLKKIVSTLFFLFFFFLIRVSFSCPHFFFLSFLGEGVPN